MKILRQLSILFVLLVSFLSPFGCGKEIQVPKKPQLVMIGMDGLDPQLLTKLLQQHQLPHFQRLLENGSFARITCVTELTSPIIWTSIATGMPPEVHGITGFTEKNVPVTSTLRRVPAFWNILTKRHFSVATLGWLTTWPAEKDAGIMVTDRAMWLNLDSIMFPDKIVDLGHLPNPQKNFLFRFTSYPFNSKYESSAKNDPKYEANFLVDQRLIEIYKRDWTYTNIALQILKERNPDIVSVYLQGADYVGHGFWKYYDPGPFRAAGWKIPEREISYFKDVIPRYYIFLDSLLGKIMQQIRKNAMIILLSDHGFGPALGAFGVEQGETLISGNHRPQAVLILAGPQIRRGVKQTRVITHYDILPTILLNLGLPLARDQYGYPLLNYFSDRFLNTSKIKFVQTYGQPKQHTEVEHSAHDEEILYELRSLGYIK